jgi:histidine triad (HIT) family protein
MCADLPQFVRDPRRGPWPPIVHTRGTCDDDLVADASVPECLECTEVQGTVDVPGGYLYTDDVVVSFHRPPLQDRTVFAGHLLVVPRRHAGGFGDLSRAEAASLGIAMHALCRALAAAGARTVYSATIGRRADNHLHVHLMPRWPETPAEVACHAVDEWPGARRLDVTGIAELCQVLRSSLGE